MAPERHGAHAEKIALGSKTFFVRRDFDLVIRIEERCGALSDIIRVLAEGHKKIAPAINKAADVLEEALRGQATRDEIEALIMEAGVLRASAIAAALIQNFFVGDERFRARLDAAKEAGELDPPAAASSPGLPYLERQQG